MVGKESEGAPTQSVPKAEYKAGECTRNYAWYGTAGKQSTEKHNAPTVVEGMYAGKTTGCMYSSK